MFAIMFVGQYRKGDQVCLGSDPVYASKDEAVSTARLKRFSPNETWIYEVADKDETNTVVVTGRCVRLSKIA